MKKLTLLLLSFVLIFASCSKKDEKAKKKCTGKDCPYQHREGRFVGNQ